MSLCVCFCLSAISQWAVLYVTCQKSQMIARDRQPDYPETRSNFYPLVNPGEQISIPLVERMKIRFVPLGETNEMQATVESPVVALASKHARFSISERAFQIVC